MGWSVSGIVSTVAHDVATVATSPITIADKTIGSVLHGTSSLVSTTLRGTGSLLGTAVRDTGGLVSPVLHGAGTLVQDAAGVVGASVQNLRPPPAPVVPKAASNLPLYLGLGAGALVLVLLLTRKPAQAAAT